MHWKTFAEDSDTYINNNKDLLTRVLIRYTSIFQKGPQQNMV